MVDLSKLASRLKKLRWRRLVVLGALLVVLVWGGCKAWRLYRLARSLQGRLYELQAMNDDQAELDLGAAGDNLRGAHADLRALRDEVKLFLPLTRLLGWAPRFGGDLRAAPELLDMAVSLTEAGTIAYEGVEPLLALVEGHETEGEPLALVVQTLEDARPNFEAAQERLARAKDLRARVDDAALSDYTASLLERLDRYLPLVETGLSGGQLLPDLLGASGQRTYLILAQNDDEMRATGGFITAMGVLTLDGGQVGDVAFQDSYSVDDFSYPYPFAPEPFWRYMRLQPWVFRDANWSPDFPTSAHKALELYRISRELQVDGILAVNQQALRAIVEALEPIKVEDWPEAVTGDNVIALIRMAWSPDEAEAEQGLRKWWGRRKNFIGDLVAAMRAKVEGSPGDVDWLALARAALQVLDERHLLVWLADSGSPAADLLAERGWDGAMRPAEGDYLQVVDSNMGYNKVNARIQPSLNYRVQIEADGTARATLTVRHVNSSQGDAPCDPLVTYRADYEELTNRCYWNYLRVYAPSGSQLQDATVHPVAASVLISGEAQPGEAEILPDEQGKAAWASFFVLPQGEETKTRFVYRLPQGTLERVGEGWRYRLLAQKQSGSRAVPLRVELVLPPGASLASAQPAARQPEPARLVFNTTLTTDQEFEVVFNVEKGGKSE
jgi:hypothetical protein